MCDTVLLILWDYEWRIVTIFLMMQWISWGGKHLKWSASDNQLICNLLLQKTVLSLPPKMRKTSCSPPHPTAIINVSSAARPCTNLGKTTWDGAVWKGSIFIPQNVENIYFLTFSVFVIIADLSLIPRLKDEHKQNGLFVCFKEGTDMLTQYSFLTHGPLGQH